MEGVVGLYQDVTIGTVNPRKRCRMRVLKFMIERFQRERKRENTPAQKECTFQKQTLKAEAKQMKRELFSHS
jgi:hypothetical protein